MKKRNTVKIFHLAGSNVREYNLKHASTTMRSRVAIMIFTWIKGGASEQVILSRTDGVGIGETSFNKLITDKQYEKKIDFAEIFVNIVNLGVRDFLPAKQGKIRYAWTW